MVKVQAPWGYLVGQLLNEKKCKSGSIEHANQQIMTNQNKSHKPATQQAYRKPSHEIMHLIRDIGLSNKALADLLQVGPRTIKRWLSGDGRPPHSTIVLLRIMTDGIHHLPGAGSDWEGWKFEEGVLYDPDAPCTHFHTPGTIRTWFMTSQMLQAHRANENRRNQALKDSDNITVFPSLNTNYWHDVTDELHAGLRDALSVHKTRPVTFNLRENDSEP
jgi:DNA-binding transcriptional regulator YiaG